MSNMSYCRFENTVGDLQDCLEQLRDYGLTGQNEYDELLSRSEFESALELIEMCQEVAQMYDGFTDTELRDEYKKAKEDMEAEDA